MLQTPALAQSYTSVQFTGRRHPNRSVFFEMDLHYRNRNFLTQFIIIYATQPCLWEVKSKEYRNQQLKAEAYGKLVEFCKTKFPEADINFVKVTIDRMRNGFRKELHKVRRSQRSGAAPDAVYKPSLWYYKFLMFSADQEVTEENVKNVDEGKKYLLHILFI